MKMSKIMFFTILLTPALSFADATGGCGVGSKLFAGQKGIAPQVLAMTTNGTFLDTVGVTSGTSGCKQDGVVSTNWKTAAYVSENMNKLASDMSRGNGESLASLGSVMGVSSADSAHFNSTLKQNFAQIFSGSEVSSEQVLANMKNVLAADATLARYSASI